MEPFSMFVVAIAVFAVVLLLLGVKTVPQGREYTVERFGRYTHTLRPGLHFIVPVVDRIGARLNMMETVLDVPSQEVITKDNAMVTVDGVVFFQVLDAARAAYEVNQLQLAILNLTMTNVRTVMGSMDLDELLSQRDKINTQLLHVVDDATQPWGVKVTRIEIRDIQPPRDLVDSMARQMKAERDRRAVILEAEGLRQAAILKAEGEKRAAILEAEGRREASFRDAEAREREAEAEAAATRMVSDAIAGGNVQAINYFVAQRYVETMAEFAKSPNQKILFMPMESSSIIGALGGIAEIARDAFPSGGGSGGSGSGGTPPSGAPRPRPQPPAPAPSPGPPLGMMTRCPTCPLQTADRRTFGRSPHGAARYRLLALVGRCRDPGAGGDVRSGRSPDLAGTGGGSHRTGAAYDA
ncbi:SPFH domain-containing protein [Indioceanicola profundi]|uniref:SPFH domain-containing protein n=1 Tax=Indioceanicola profundi TaxID=2220096 RepID=UPI001CED040B|nr:SPFH domain-containing protein [Indioceanicola profundi]